MSDSFKTNGELSDEYSTKVYSNAGNIALIDMLSTATRFLDIGCGTGDNAVLVKTKFETASIQGVTYSNSEGEIAKKRMKKCWVFNIEQALPIELEAEKFDCLIFSHVLEHLRDPAKTLARFSSLLCHGGQVLIAVPNILSWRMRIRFLMGDFTYESAGELDDTHLRFFTYLTADKYLLSECQDLEIVRKTVSGSVPLWWLRRYILPRRWAAKIDQWACKQWPNLFGDQVLLKVVKR